MAVGATVPLLPLALSSSSLLRPRAMSCWSCELFACGNALGVGLIECTCDEGSAKM